MKFPVDKCETCDLDLTTAEPAKVNYFDSGIAIGTCPGCGRPYTMVEVEAPKPEPVTEPISTSRAGRRRVSEPEPEPELETPPAEE